MAVRQAGENALPTSPAHFFSSSLLAPFPSYSSWDQHRRNNASGKIEATQKPATAPHRSSWSVNEKDVMASLYLAYGVPIKHFAYMRSRRPWCVSAFSTVSSSSMKVL